MSDRDYKTRDWWQRRWLADRAHDWWATGWEVDGAAFCVVHPAWMCRRIAWHCFAHGPTNIRTALDAADAIDEVVTEALRLDYTVIVVVNPQDWPAFARECDDLRGDVLLRWLRRQR